MPIKVGGGTDRAMIYFVVLTAGLAFAAWNAEDRSTRWFLIAACALNLAAALVASHDQHIDAFWKWERWWRQTDLNPF